MIRNKNIYFYTMFSKAESQRKIDKYNSDIKHTF